MNENLQKWSLIAEIVGGLGVLITLVILILEVRENSELTRTVAYQQEIQNYNNWRNEMLGDPDQIRIFGAWSRRENIPDRYTDDGLILIFILMNLFTNYESAYYSQRSGILGESEWNRVQIAICSAYEDIVQEKAYWDSVSFRLTEPFNGFIEASCQNR